MGKHGGSVMLGAGSTAGQKRKSPGGDENDDDNPLCRLSLGSIYTAAVAVVEPASKLLLQDSQHSADASPAAADMTSRVQVPAGGTAFLATGLLAQGQIGSSSSILVDGNGGASPFRFRSLPVVRSPVLLVAPPVSPPVKQVAGIPATKFAPVKHDVQEAPSPSPARRRAKRAQPSQPSVVAGGPPPPASKAAAPGGQNNGSPAANSVGPPLSPPFLWCTNRTGYHLSISELAQRGITAIDGEVQCSRCETRNIISYDVAAKFGELFRFVSCNNGIDTFNDRAPPEWTKPALPACVSCGQGNSMRPVIAADKEKINWMFLLLGQTLGLCSLNQLKHFLAHTKEHRTGSKDRVLYSVYMELCYQLSRHKLFKLTDERKKASKHFKCY